MQVKEVRPSIQVAPLCEKRESEAGVSQQSSNRSE